MQLENFSTYSALLASISYVLFSKYYERSVRTNKDLLIGAFILYFIAGSGLLLTSLIFLAYFSFDHLPFSKLVAFGFNFQNSNAIIILLSLIVVMTICYAIHIKTEAYSRNTINMGIYSIIFQLNVLIVALLDSVIYKPFISYALLMGGILIFIASIAGLLIQRFDHSEDLNLEVNNSSFLIAVISAVSCGFALFIDGELMRNLIEGETIQPTSLCLFFFYESITFLIPSLWVFLFLKIFQKSTFNLGKLLSVFSSNRRNFLLSSFFSACQFVFTVFAFSLPGARFKVVAILASAPFLCVLLDKNPRLPFILRLEQLCALLVGIGVYLVAVN